MVDIKTHPKYGMVLEWLDERTRDLVIDDTSDSVSVSCSHDGYSRLSTKPIHRRTWGFLNQM